MDPRLPDDDWNMLTAQEICQRLKIGLTTLEEIRCDPDEGFPQPCDIRKRSVRWFSNEVKEWAKLRQRKPS